jgi:preprotein translocase subunit SecA
MAGRGTDILLGGNPEILAQDFLRQRGFDPAAPEFDEDGNPNELYAPEIERKGALEKAKIICESEQEEVRRAGGLCVIGTERHESRRIDNQLRGRSGRQGDPGETQFYLSLEDDLMRLFGGSKMESISAMMEKTGLEDDMPIQASMVSKSIESAQRQVEGMHFSARKNVLEYDDVMNLQRRAIYEERNAILDGKSISERIPEIITDSVESEVSRVLIPDSADEDWDERALELWVSNMCGKSDFKVSDIDHDEDPGVVSDALIEYLLGVYHEKEQALGPAIMDNLSSQVMLRIIDTRWMAHLQEMDYLKTGIGLRAFGQRDPLVEYKNEAYGAFEKMTASMYDDYLRTLLRLEIAIKVEQPEADPLEGKNVSYSSPEESLTSSDALKSPEGAQVTPSANQRGGAASGKQQVKKAETYVKDKDDPYANVGRNDPCPCGSGKKYKKCHGINA